METNTTDEELLSAAAQGSEEAFATLFRRRQAGIYRFALHMSANPTVADEVTQEVFVTLARDCARFDSTRGSVNSYLLGIARNLILRVFEKKGFDFVPIDDGVADLLVDGSNPLGDLTRSEEIGAVRAAVARLPPNFREVVVLCDLEELTYADAAAALRVPIGTVRSRLSRGRGLLLEDLQSRSQRAGAGASSSLGCLA